MILFLIGYRATGKTTIGRLLADQLGCLWIDLDSEIEKFAQQSIPEIFAERGEAGFRELESTIMNMVVTRARLEKQTVISLGGGAVISGANRNLIKKSGRCVWLTAPADSLVERIKNTRDQTPRPALTELDPADEVSRLLQDREPVYSDCADYTIDTGSLNAEQAAEQIALWWSDVDKN